jgi:hypothetical protein
MVEALAVSYILIEMPVLTKIATAILKSEKYACE